MIKLVLSDLDGTLLSDEKIITEENKRAIKELKNKGVIFCICTGRIYMSAYLVGEEIGNDFPIISCNGAYVKNPKTGEIIFNYSIKEDIALKIINILEKYDITYHFYDEDTVFSNKCERAAKNFIDRFKDLENKPINVIIDEHLANKMYLAKSINKFIAFKDKGKNVESCLSELKEIAEIDISQSGEDNIEIMSKGISKGSALNILKKMYNVSSDEVMTLGDEMNDLSMFVESKYSISMENARKTLKEKTYFTTKTNNDSGVAYAIDKFVLEKGE